MCTLLNISIILGSLLHFCNPVSMATVDSNCDFFQEMTLGTTYYIYNKEYSNNYVPGTSCRWTARSEPYTNIVMSCEVVDLPSSNNCQLDKLLVSLTGDENLQDGRSYCGKGSLSLVTESNKLVVGLFAVNNSPGGKFLCSLTPMQSSPPPPTQRPDNCNCGWKKGTRIVGGHETGVNEFPFMAALLNVNVNGESDVNCGASIISDRYALTAGHCLYQKDIRQFGLLVGDHDLDVGNDTDAARLYKLIRFIIHPQFVNPKVNDVGIVQTELPITFSMYVGPVCLPFKYTTQELTGLIVTALGWGFLDYSGPRSNTLQEVDLDIISNSQCASSLTNEAITSKQFCTYTPHKDTCLADSGGPLIWQDPETRRLQLIGTISYGLGCATQRPAVNTRVSSYLPWIVSVTTDAMYCIL